MFSNCFYISQMFRFSITNSVLIGHFTSLCKYRIYSDKRRVSPVRRFSRGRRLFKRLISQTQNILIVQFNLLHQNFFMAYRLEANLSLGFHNSIVNTFLGPVVQKPINANPRLKINQEVYFSIPKCCSTLIFG